MRIVKKWKFRIALAVALALILAVAGFGMLARRPQEAEFAQAASASDLSAQRVMSIPSAKGSVEYDVIPGMGDSTISSDGVFMPTQAGTEKASAFAPLPLLLTVIPNGAVIACIVLGVAIAVATVALVVVAVTGKKKKAEPQKEPIEVAEAEPEETPEEESEEPAKNPQEAPERGAEEAHAPLPSAPVGGVAIAGAALAGGAAAGVGAAAAPVAVRRMRYERSFLARLIQSDETTKGYYCAIKGEILAYGAKSRISWKHEAFRVGKLVVKLTFRGKTLCVFYALSASQYAETKYKVEDMSWVAQYEQTPCLYRIFNDRRSRYAFDLIADVMATVGRERRSDVAVTAPPYETTEALLGRKLIRLVEGTGAAGDDDDGESIEIPVLHSVRAAEVGILRDEVAVSLVEVSRRVADKTKTGIINIDVLSQNFNDGETVTLDEIKARIPGYKKITYIKVLARGSLDKALTVEADEFSIEAVKMIVLTGGKAIRTMRQGD